MKTYSFIYSENKWQLLYFFYVFIIYSQYGILLYYNTKHNLNYFRVKNMKTLSLVPYMIKLNIWNINYIRTRAYALYYLASMWIIGLMTFIWLYMFLLSVQRHSEILFVITRQSRTPDLCHCVWSISRYSSCFAF